MPCAPVDTDTLSTDDMHVAYARAAGLDVHKMINDNYFCRRIASQRLLTQQVSLPHNSCYPRRGGLDRQVSARRRPCPFMPACSCAHRRQGASLRSAPASRG